MIKGAARVPILDGHDFHEQVIQASGTVLIYFATWWSEECRHMLTVIKNTMNKLDAHDRIVQVDWDEQRQLAKRLNVFGVPTLLLYMGGEERARYFGTMNREDLIKRITEAKRRFFCNDPYQAKGEHSASPLVRDF